MVKDQENKKTVLLRKIISSFVCKPNSLDNWSFGGKTYIIFLSFLW